MKIIIATSSKNRKNIIQKLFPETIFEPSTYIEKNYKIHIFPILLAKKNSRKKAIHSNYENSITIGFDTIIYKNFRIYNKPKNITEARKILKALSGKWHTVVTGVTVIYKNKIHTYAIKSRVKFYKLTDEKIDYYLSLNESIGRAGGYAIQKMGKEIVIEKYTGDYFNIIGVPIFFIKSFFYNLHKNFPRPAAGSRGVCEKF